MLALGQAQPPSDLDGDRSSQRDHHASEGELFGNLSEREPGQSLESSRATSPSPFQGRVSTCHKCGSEEIRRDPADKVADEQEVPMVLDPRDSSSSHAERPQNNMPGLETTADEKDSSLPLQTSTHHGTEEERAVQPIPTSVSAMRGSTMRPDNLNVHWRNSARSMRHSTEANTQEKEEGHSERSHNPFAFPPPRVTRRSTGHPTIPSSDHDSDDQTEIDGISSSAVSLASSGCESEAGSSRHSRRRSSQVSDASSGRSSDWSEEEGRSGGGSGVLSELLSLYRTERDENGTGVMRSLMSTSKRRRRSEDKQRHRRWSETSLFSVSSHRRKDKNERDNPTSEDENSSDGQGNSSRCEEKRVRRNRKRQQIPHRSQNPEDPYIPSPHYSNPMTPSPNVTIAQRFGRIVTYLNPTSYLSNSSSSSGDIGGDKKYRHIVALVISTSGLAGAATPSLAHLAPAAGRGAETSDGMRKLSWYEGESESAARREDQERREDEAMGMTDEETNNLGKAMEEGKLKKGSKWRKRGTRRGKRTQKEMAVTRNIASIIQRKKFIEMLAKSVVNYGAPAHSIEQWLESTADILQVEASFVHIPGILIVAFRDTDVHSTDILFIRPRGSLELYRLSLVHQVYRKVVHDEISASQGCRVLRRINKQTIPYPRLFLICMAAVASGTSARVAFSGSFIDMLMAGTLGSFLAVIHFTVAQKHRLISNIFEIGVAGFISFFARGLGSSHYFCYDSVASAAIVLILPGWHICLGALELGSKNVVGGVIRVVWAIIYTLFLSFGLSIGSQVWDAFGPEQLTAPTGGDGSTVNIQGSFSSNDTQWDNTFQNGTFTFSNSSSMAISTITCYRNPEWNYWWYKELNDWWLFLFVPLFAVSLAIWFRADYRSKDMVVMVLVACAGYVVNFFLDSTNVTSAVAAFTVGLLGNLYSRLGRGSAFPSMVVGILLLVPNGIAAAGGLSASSSSTSTSDGSSSEGENPQSLNAAVIVSIRLIQVGVGLAIGLFAAALVVYPFGKKRRYIFSY